MNPSLKLSGRVHSSLSLMLLRHLLRQQAGRGDSFDWLWIRIEECRRLSTSKCWMFIFASLKSEWQRFKCIYIDTDRSSTTIHTTERYLFTKLEKDLNQANTYIVCKKRKDTILIVYIILERHVTVLRSTSTINGSNIYHHNAPSYYRSTTQTHLQLPKKPRETT